MTTYFELGLVFDEDDHKVFQNFIDWCLETKDDEWDALKRKTKIDVDLMFELVDDLRRFIEKTIDEQKEDDE